MKKKKKRSLRKRRLSTQKLDPPFLDPSLLTQVGLSSSLIYSIKIANEYGEKENGDAPAWTSRLTSTLSPSKFAPVVLRSTRWPGAVVVSYNDKFANVYMGDGLKDLGSPAPFFAPPSLPAIQGEYVAPEDAPEILNEQIDPSIEAEAAIEAEKLAKEEAAKAQQEGGEAEEPEEDE